MRFVGIAAVEEQIEHPGHPEILLDVLEWRAQPVGGRQKQTPTIIGVGSNHAKKIWIHGLASMASCLERMNRSRIHFCIHQ